MIISKGKVCDFLLNALFFLSTDTVLFGTNANQSFLYVPRIMGLIFIVIIFMIFPQKRRVIKKDFFLLAIFLSILTLSAIINEENILTYISRLIPIVSAYMIAKYYSIELFINKFNKFVYIVAIFGIIFEIFYLFVPGVLEFFPLIINTAGISFRTIGLGSIEVNQLGLCRANGIFWEPGAFAVYLNIAIYFVLFREKEIKKKRFIIYCIALFITLSTTGYIAFFIIVLLFFLFKKNIYKKKLNYKIVEVFLIVLLILITFNNNIIYENVFTKLVNKTSTTMVRLTGIIGGIQIVYENPLLGVFSSKIRPILSVYQPASAGMLTNTIIYQFTAYGILFGFLFCLYSIKFFIMDEKSKFLKLGLCVFWNVIFISEMFYSFLPFLFVFYSLRGGKNENSHNKYISIRKYWKYS